MILKYKSMNNFTIELYIICSMILMYKSMNNFTLELYI
jgi:hypothetical protein